MFPVVIVGDWAYDVGRARELRVARPDGTDAAVDPPPPTDGDFMYKLLLCWRYLRTRYIAMICIVSVMLGVATLIVVNGVMAGFSEKMTSEMNGMVGDLVLRAHSVDGELDPDAHMKYIREAVGDEIAGMSPALVIYAMMYLPMPGGNVTRGVYLVGIDETTFASVSDVDRFLRHPKNRQQISFELQDGGYDVVDMDAPSKQKAKSERIQLRDAGVPYRRAKFESARRLREAYERSLAAQRAQAGGASTTAANPFAGVGASSAASDAKSGADEEGKAYTGVILPIGECSLPDATGKRHLGVRPGDDVIVAMPTASLPPEVLSDKFTIVDVYDDPMQMENAAMAFVPLRHLQRARNMVDPVTGVGRFTAIQIKLRDGADLSKVREKLRQLFDANRYSISTWQDDQANLLAAIHTEKVVLNILLCFIIAVAGFGILSIFSMIVMEKTRDIGILKSMGASSWGVMGIFLAYGLTLGLVGAGAGVALGLLISARINEVKNFFERFLDVPLFDQSVYMFDTLPSVVYPWMVVCVATGAIAIAVLAAVLPAFRAARLHPVAALRFE
jgi:lipoprotein-releasing system permease protein